MFDCSERCISYLESEVCVNIFVLFQEDEAEACKGKKGGDKCTPQGGAPGVCQGFGEMGETVLCV